MLYIFDLDDTLISSYMAAPGKRYDRWRVLPGRSERLAELRRAGHQLAIATNQAGVAFGIISEAQVRAKLAAVLAALDLPPDTPVAICFAHPRSRIARYRDPAEIKRRKPSGAMLRELMDAYPAAAAENVLYIGDRPEDAAAARDADISFRWANQFFA